MTLTARTLRDAYAEDRLPIPVCEACGTPHLYPAIRCPSCRADRVTTRDAAGPAMVVSFTTVHRPPSPAFAAEVPYTIGLVRLAEGPRLMARITGDPALLRVGAALRLGFATMPGGERMPAFQLVEHDTWAARCGSTPAPAVDVP